MNLYYLLLFFARFHDDPRLGGTLFDAGFLMVSPVKIVGALTLVAAVITKRPVDAAPRRRNLLVGMFLLFPVLPLMVVIVSGRSLPDEWLSHLISFIMMLLATRLLICSEERMYSTIRALVLVYLFSTLWIFKQHFILHTDRVRGLEWDPNYEALGLVMMIPLVVWMARHEQRTWLKRLGLFSVPIFVYAMLLTESRGGALALALLGLGGFLRSRHKVAITVFVVAIFPLVMMAMPAGFLSRIGNTKISGVPVNGDEESSRIHFELMRAGVQMMAKKPLLGVGIGRFSKEAEKYNPDLVNVSDQTYIAHNTYLQVGAECGFPVLAIWLSLLFSALSNLRYIERLAHGESSGDLALAIRLALLAYSVSAFFLTAEWVVPYWLMIFFSQSLREIVAAKREVAERLGRETTGFRRAYVPATLALSDA
jgi:O-antigen ligase